MNCRVVLGIETSCDETAAALLIDGKVVSDRTTRQLLHEEYGGVVPELASRAHERLLSPAVEAVLRDAGTSARQLDAVAATCGPGLPGALMVGVSFAKGLAAAVGIPWLGVNHVEGHLWSAELASGPLPLPFLGLVISGGHTLLLEARRFGEYVRLGSTRDDAAGELFDKVGRMIGFPFPAGADIDRLASGFKGEAVRFPRARLLGDPLGFSFSGLKTAALYYLRSRYRQGNAGFEMSPEERAAVATGIMEAVADMLADGIAAALDAGSYRALVVTGGVASSIFLRGRLARLTAVSGVPLRIPPPELCTDNGAMVAYVGFRRLQQGFTSPPDLSIDPAADICQV